MVAVCGDGIGVLPEHWVKPIVEALEAGLNVATGLHSRLSSIPEIAAAAEKSGGKLHDVRFKQMEFTLPDEYKEGAELEKQRKIHDSLITRGLHLISDSYMDEMASWAEEAGLDFERKHFDGIVPVDIEIE